MKNEIVWITGASSGIGRETALLFVKSGITIAASARNTEMLEKLKDSLGDMKKFFRIFPCDVSSYENVNDTYNKISKEYFVSALINDAGVTSFKPAVDDSIEEIQNIINTNLLGSIYTTKSVIPEMVNANKGLLINIISVVTKKIFIASSTYSASKAGLLAYADVLREELRKNNIKVVNIIPGATKTPIWPNSALEKYSERMMSPLDVAGMILYVYNLERDMVPEEITLRPLKGDL